MVSRMSCVINFLMIDVEIIVRLGLTHPQQQLSFLPLKY
jgi:hypothetical protein